MANSDTACARAAGQVERAAKQAEAKALWAELGDVCVDDEGLIDAPWRDYPAGTDREGIWHDVEDEYGDYGVTVARLMGIEPWPPEERGTEME